MSEFIEYSCSNAVKYIQREKVVNGLSPKEYVFYIILDSLTLLQSNHSLSNYGFRVQKGEGRNNNMKSCERLMHKSGDLMLYHRILTKSAILDYKKLGEGRE